MEAKVKDKRINNQIKRISEKYSKSEEEVIREALNNYEEYADLFEEFDAWNKLSDKTLIEFEKQI